MRLSVFLAFACAALPSPPTARAEQEGAAVGGAGNATCEYYMDLVRKDPEHADFAFQSWAQGFISGINYRALKDPAASGGMIDMNPRDYPPSRQLRFLHNYCVLNPSLPVLSAVIALVDDLRKTEILGPKPPRRPPPATE